jgi:hypothetical protein
MKLKYFVILLLCDGKNVSVICNRICKNLCLSLGSLYQFYLVFSKLTRKLSDAYSFSFLLCEWPNFFHKNHEAEVFCYIAIVRWEKCFGYMQQDL